MNVVLLAALMVVAQSGPTPSPQTNVVTSTVSADGGTLVWYVDVRGADTNTCTAPFTDGGRNGPCRQPQGAINRIPKMLRHGAYVSVDAGTYNCFFIYGFTCDPGFQTSSGGLAIDGAMVTSTLATGSATGTFTSSTAGSTVTYGTGTDSTAAWTVNDLKGRFIAVPGQTRVISSNTATTITIVGTWTSPGAVAYTIQDPGPTISTACPAPASPSSPAAADNASILIAGNNCSARTGSIMLRGLRVAPTNASADGVHYNDTGGADFRLMQVRPTGSEATAFQAGGPTLGAGGVVTGRFEMTDVDITGVGPTNSPMSIIAGAPSITRLLIRNATASGGAFNVSSPTARPSISTVDIQGASGFGLVITAGHVRSLSGAHIDCTSSAGTGILVGSNTANVQTGPSQFAQISSAQVTTCGTAVSVTGALAGADINALSGSAATTGLLARSGASVSYAKASVTLTAGTNEVNIESGEVTGTFAAGTAGQCRVSSVSGNYSRVCAR